MPALSMQQKKGGKVRWRALVCFHAIAFSIHSIFAFPSVYHVKWRVQRFTLLKVCPQQGIFAVAMDLKIVFHTHTHLIPFPSLLLLTALRGQVGMVRSQGRSKAPKKEAVSLEQQALLKEQLLSASTTPDLVAALQVRFILGSGLYGDSCMLCIVRSGL